MKEEIYRLPQEFLAKLKKIYPGNYHKIYETFLEKKTHTFRINYLKTELRELRKVLINEKIKCKELSYPKGSFILKSDFRKLQKSFIYRDGLIYVQNISSMVPPLVLAPEGGERILDLCAAPGAKTTQIVSLAGKDIELVAIEKIRVRYYKLLANLKIQGVDFITPLLLDGIWVRKKFSEYFDKILLDSPCSCEGLFFVKNPRSYKYWKQRKVKEMAHKQRKLIFSAIHSLKEGGVLVYSTCTFSPEENEGVIDWVLNRFKDSLGIVPIKVPLNNVIPGLIRWRDKKFSSDLKFCARIMPDHFMEGFFLAKLIKKKAG